MACLSGVVVPVFLDTDTDASHLLRQWVRVYHYGHIYMPALGVATSGLYAYTAIRNRAHRQTYTLAALTTIAMVPFTWIFMAPTNNTLFHLDGLATAGTSVAELGAVQEILIRWSWLHLFRPIPNHLLPFVIFQPNGLDPDHLHDHTERTMGHDSQIFAQDDSFWQNYLKGRPQAPPSFFSRIFDYHSAHNGSFDVVHDVGAGNGPYSRTLRARFSTVIISDIVSQNVSLAQQRLGTDGYRYRTASVEDAADIPAGSVDMVFATNVMHFPADQHKAMSAVAHQLRPGGTFACGTFGPARFEDPAVQDLWQRISYEGGRQLLAKKGGEDPEETLRVMARTGQVNFAPLDEALFEKGALRVHFNWGHGGIVGLLPPELNYKGENSFTGTADRVMFEEDKGWGFEKDLAGVKEHICSFPFVAENLEAFGELFAELEELLKNGRVVKGHFPAQLVLATRR
ncbi:hypothetical protein Asppvi_000042 [Aspergillus pseudoviridinutans]|uniref:Methyltransferase type 11 domain-containing protein n=1 Tax=Aspergillus pseudoviridinutans TaxID=1517512 RepID=A0A9P3B4A5_9EURO|nr:uncharacterized protein Asppvi_000042 [Aspergillus pseudoviridinutans]GIJ81543.1 hypothetical protein Asppvi_000042 [Aspergillus pseudoviridinutans]